MPIFANSYIGFAQLLCYILAGLAALSFVMSGLIIFGCITSAAEKAHNVSDYFVKFDHPKIAPSLVFQSGDCVLCNITAMDCCSL